MPSRTEARSDGVADQSRPTRAAGPAIAELWRSRSLDEAAAYAASAEPEELCTALAGLTEGHEAAFGRSLDLVGSHGLMSRRARSLLGSGLIDQMRQAGLPGRRIHAGSFWIDRIETIAIGLAKRLFGAAYAEVRPLSCAVANGLVFAALARRGDTIMAQTRLHGADPSITPNVFGALLGHEYVDLPYDEAEFAVDLDRAVRAIRATRPRLVVVGSGFILFPYPVGELKAAAASVGAKLFYDGAHASGLTAGGQYQDPIAEGADVVTGSVPKTLCGPTGGIVLTNDPEVAAAVQDITSRVISSYPNNNIGALAVTLAEMIRFGKDFAAALVANARALAEALDAEGFTVLAKARGFTRSHLVLFEVDGDAVEAWRRLDQAGIFATAIRLPAGSPLRGIRVGTASVTRRGMGQADMKTIARFVGRVLRDGETPAAVAADVAAFASDFTRVHYGFD